MAIDVPTRSGKVPRTHKALSANERAILDHIPIPFLRTLVTHVWETKVRLQFTGWLQYLLPGLISLLVFLVTGRPTKPCISW